MFWWVTVVTFAGMWVICHCGNASPPRIDVPHITSLIGTCINLFCIHDDTISLFSAPAGVAFLMKWKYMHCFLVIFLATCTCTCTSVLILVLWGAVSRNTTQNTFSLHVFCTMYVHVQVSKATYTISLQWNKQDIGI